MAILGRYKYSYLPPFENKSKVKEEVFRETHTIFVHEGIEYYVTADKELIEVPLSF